MAVHYRWPLTTGVAQGRYYCIKYIWIDVLLSKTLVRRNRRLQQSERLGYIVPFASSILEFKDMHEVWNFICNPLTSDNDNMEDACDGNYVRSLPFLQQNTNAWQVILSHDDLEIVNHLGVHTKSIRLACSITH